MGSVNDAQLPYYIKTEATPSPDLSPVASADLHHFQFKFSPAHTSSNSHSNLYRFGTWPSTVSHLPPRVSSAPQFHSSSMSYSDDYDDIGDLPADHSGLSPSYGGTSAAIDRIVRRRSSKACDQCRKSKCKCERSSPNEACKNCLMLGTACTFLGPSRKRGPPKGYIDAIEARLHQTEALLGIMLSTSDPRAQSLLRDIGKDPLAREIISRVDNSPYGVKGRKREDIALTVGKIRSGHSSETSQHGQTKPESATLDLASTHPSNEWQDRVSSMLNAVASQGTSLNIDTSNANHLYSPKSQSSDDNFSPGGRRQRRRVGDEDYRLHGQGIGFYSASAPGSAVSLQDAPASRLYASRAGFSQLSPVHAQFRISRSSGSARGRANGEKRSSSVDHDDSMSSDSEDDFAGAIGQLSLNEDEQVRYHGKASGLHLLGNKERVDRRNEGGIWRFPKARVWPPLPSGSKSMNPEDEFISKLPSPEVQEHLLDLYFTYVHPSFPIIHKQSFLDAYRSANQVDSPSSPNANTTGTGTPAHNNNTSPFNRRPRHIPTLLLFSIFALASRYDCNATPLPSDPSMMWSAGDEYLDWAKVVLDSTYASSRSSTCQALLLLGYREIGIGAMAQAWTYIGMGIRMAQDLGMHRSADGWERPGLGGRLFGEWELAERKRVWFGCVIMDKYVSAYIGRPLMIFESDFDTTLPSVDDLEESEEWSVETQLGERSAPVPGRVISCFNASAALSGILSIIVQSIYAVRPTSSRHAESTVLESLLDKWYIDLPDHLRYEPGAGTASKQPTPLPNVLTLHMQYWCAVLLLHRPFISHVLHGKLKQSEDPEEAETWAAATKSYELCNAAANHITSTVTLYQERYLISRCSVFLCYYVFTASIMHDTNLTVHPSDPQSQLGLSKCLNALRAMRVVWPSAARALDLFGGTKNGTQVENNPSLVSLLHPSKVDRHKRAADQELDDTFSTTHPALTVGGHGLSQGQNQFDYMPLVRQNNPSTTQQQQQYAQHAHSTSVYAADYLPASQSSSTTVGLAASLSNPNYWQSGDINTGFHGPLSTAVIPQLYSSGLVDDISGGHSRIPTHHTHSSSLSHHPGHSSRSEYVSVPQSHTDHQQSQPKGRYPSQYYDYSNFPQTTYDMQDQVAASQHSSSTHTSQQQRQSQQSSHMYIPDQYGIYNTQPYNTR